MKTRKVGVGLIYLEKDSPFYSEARIQCTEELLEDEALILMISSRRHANRLVFPKGGCEDGESIEETVIRETWEEAGIRTKIKCFVGEITSEQGRRPSTYYLYELEVISIEQEWPEKSDRKRCWLSYEKASAACDREFMQVLLENSSLVSKLQQNPLTSCELL